MWVISQQLFGGIFPHAAAAGPLNGTANSNQTFSEVL